MTDVSYVEIGGERMTEAQFKAARFPLQEELDRRNVGGFPMPFGGITESLELPPAMLRAAIAFMAAGCEVGHQHNIAVAFDGNRVHTTKLGIECIKRLLGELT